MQEAIRLALDKMREGAGGPFGAVIVKDGQVVGRGWNQVTSTNDPTAHAEVMAIREACRHLGSYRLDGCELYWHVTRQPRHQAVTISTPRQVLRGLLFSRV